MAQSSRGANRFRNLLMKAIFVYKGGDQEVPNDVERVRMDPSVKVIKSKAFYLRKKLKWIQFSEGLEEIGKLAFSGCISLESVRLPSTTQIIRDGAFCECLKVEHVILNEGLQEIGEYVFQGCRMIKFVCLPSTMLRLKEGAFYGCTSLTKVALNEKLATVGRYAFHDCCNLERIVIPCNDTLIGCDAIPPKTRRDTTMDEGFWDTIIFRGEATELARLEKYGVVPSGDEDSTTGLKAIREEVRLLKEALDLVRAQADEQRRSSMKEAEDLRRECEDLRAALEQKGIESKSCATDSTNDHGDDARTVATDYSGALNRQVDGMASERCYASISGVGEFRNMAFMVTKDGSNGDIRLEISESG